MYRQYLTRDRQAFVASVAASARACQGSVPFVSRWCAVPASTMGEALYTTRSRVLNRNDTLQRAPDASRTPGLCGPPAAAAENVSGWRNYALSFAFFPRGGATARTSNPRPGPRTRRRGHLAAYRRVLWLLLLLGRRRSGARETGKPLPLPPPPLPCRCPATALPLPPPPLPCCCSCHRGSCGWLPVAVCHRWRKCPLSRTMYLHPMNIVHCHHVVESIAMYIVIKRRYIYNCMRAAPNNFEICRID